MVKTLAVWYGWLVLLVPDLRDSFRRSAVIALPGLAQAGYPLLIDVAFNI